MKKRPDKEVRPFLQY